MESRWSVPDGKTLKETKVSDRRKELHMTAACLQDITSHLTSNDRNQALQEAEDAKVRKIKETSEEMTKDWTDSIQRQHAQRQAELEEMLNKQDDKNLIRFLSVRKEQEAERKMYVSEVRHKLLQRKDFPKALGSAYLFSEVLHEREKQKEFKKVIKAHNDEVVKKEVEEMWVDVAKYAEEEAERKKELQDKNSAHAVELRKQVEAVRKANEKARAEKIEEELIDQLRARNEAKRIEEVRVKKVADQRKQVRDSTSEFLDEQLKEREKSRLEANNSEMMRKLMQKSRDHIQAMMKQKDKELQEARIARGLSAFDNSMQLKRDAEMKLIYDKGVEKFEEDERSRDEAMRKRQGRLRQEIIDEHVLSQQKLEVDRKHRQDRMKWQMLNRFKVTEQEKKHNEELKKNEDEKREALLAVYRNEMELREELAKKEASDEVGAIRAKNDRHDKEYMEYAKEVRDLAEAQGWNTVPIDKVITKYRQNVMGEERPDRCKTQRQQSLQPCGNKAHACMVPGKRTHCPATDPTILRCKHQRDRALQ